MTATPDEPAQGEEAKPQRVVLHSREAILAAVATYQLVEAYPDDKYLPSYLILARHGSQAFHVLFATDVEGDNVRVVTSYRPDPGEWEADLKARRSKR
ncbi:MAG: hypothetical protein A2X52_05315 [Candidatus Rokubacteria bacterium GWC2_70_16]|nr:MAG: hypothetical protein A2X52_05315 [Candidatus Rokubacteria bacterium GWC2_70_16]